MREAQVFQTGHAHGEKSWQAKRRASPHLSLPALQLVARDPSSFGTGLFSTGDLRDNGFQLLRVEGKVPHVFFSYSSRDRSQVERFARILQKDHGLSYWIDTNEILAGDSLIGKINEGLSVSEVVVLWVTARSVRSNWVKIEWESTLARQTALGLHRIVPIVAEDGIELPIVLADVARLNLCTLGVDEAARKLAERVTYGYVGRSGVFFWVLQPSFGTNCKAFWASPEFREELAKLWTGKTGNNDPLDYECRFRGITNAPAESIVKLDIHVEGVGRLWPQPGGLVLQNGTWEATGYLRYGRMQVTSLVFTLYGPGTAGCGSLPLVKRTFRIE